MPLPPTTSGSPLVIGHSPSIIPRQRRGGFALLITITLLAFLVLLLVSLAALTRVETQVANNNQQLAQARQNALMALNIAVGQLQKYAGPDQRTTARADLQNPADQTNAHWIGVYGSSIAADYDATPETIAADLTDPAKVNAFGSPARLLNWLVSGNETTAFDPAWGTGDVGTSGEITGYPDPASATAIPFKPAGTVTGLTADTAATDTTLKITNAAGEDQDARLLVGGNSVTSSLDSSSKPIDYVVAPAVDIDVPASQIPGGGGSDPVTIGRYAWWVGDEGMKARVNLPLADELQEKRNAFSNSTRTAIELMDGANPMLPAPALDAPRIDTLYDPGSTTLPVTDILAVSQTPLTSNDPAAMSAALKYRFHDVTARSMSVLSDTYAGGLKKDLTHILADPSSGPANTDTLWTPVTTTENTTFIPTWGLLRDFHDTTAPGGVITPYRPIYDDGTAGKIGAYPIVTYAALGFSFEAAATAVFDPDNGVPEGTEINLNIYPIVAIWNPYNKKMAGHSYEIGIGFMRNDGGDLKLQVDHPDPTAPDTPVWEDKALFSLRDIDAPKGVGTDYPVRYFRFKVNCPELEPGETRLLTLSANTTYQPGISELNPGLNPHRYASISTGTVVATEDVGQSFRTIGRKGLKSGNGHTAVYLGESGVPPSSHWTGDWDHVRNQWYQTIQRIDYGGIVVPHAEDNESIWADPALLSPPSAMRDPALKWITMSIFSGIGRGYVLYNKYGGNIPRYRWIAQGNIRAPALFRTRRDPNHVTPYYCLITPNSDAWPTWYLEPTDGSQASSGISLDRDLTTNEAVRATLFEVRAPDQPLTSIGHLQQANLSLTGSYPSYPVGNSIADFRLQNTEWLSATGGSAVDVAVRQSRYYDASWLLNRTLWDRYYFSTVPSSGAIPPTLDNPRIVPYDTPDDSDLRTNADTPAAHLLLAGGFNINSTSEQAWRAVLGGTNLLNYDPESGNTSATPLGIVFSRFFTPKGGTDLPSNVLLDESAASEDESEYTYYKGDDMQSLWQGHHVLSPEQVAQVAHNIVAEVRTRGPFISLADFVNRRLIDNDPFVEATAPYPVKPSLNDTQKQTFLVGMKGAIQGAIDATPTTNTSGPPETHTFASNELSGDTFWNNTRTMNNFTPGTLTYYSLPLARGDINDTPVKSPQRTTSAFAPKFLTQGDILAAIGAGLSARSDTFTIRTYGETVNPVTQEINGRAWCEAVVQRIPGYIDSNVSTGNNPEDPVSALTAMNKTFGREFKIISFRWLNSNDI